MAKAGSEMYLVFEEAASVSSANTTDIKTLAPAGGKRAIGVWLSVETNDARITFSGTAPGAGTGPGQLVKAGGQPQFFPFAIGPNSQLKFASNTAAASLVTPTYVS